jgi:hypothetical protein
LENQKENLEIFFLSEGRQSGNTAPSAWHFQSISDVASRQESRHTDQKAIVLALVPIVSTVV